MATCSNCGAEISEGTQFCPKCGTPVKVQEGSGQQGSGRTPAESSNGVAEEPGHGLAIGGLVCGIVGLVCCFIGYGCLIGIVLGIVGMVLASSAKKKGNAEGVRTAGFVLSLVAIIVGAIVLLSLVFAFAVSGSIFHYALTHM